MKNKFELMFWDFPENSPVAWTVEVFPSDKTVGLRCNDTATGQRIARITFSADTSIEFIEDYMKYVGFSRPERNL